MFLLTLAQRKPQRRTLRTHFRMKLQERSTSTINKCCPLANRHGGILLPTPAAPVTRIWLLREQFLLLLLFSGLQRPTGSSEVAIKIDFDLAPGSFDDQYQGCSQEVMEELNQGDYFTEELKAHGNYFGVWQKAHLTWLSQGKTLPKNMNITHAVAILVYSSNNSVSSEFTRAMASAARSPQPYKHSFHFKYLHYYLTSAIQLLREEIVLKNGSLCYEVHHEGVYLEAYTGATIRFGQFLSASLLREKAQQFGNQTLFTVFTCLGAPIQDFSFKKVLVPPYELFEVVNMSYHPRGNWLQLRSTGNLSMYNCQLLKDSSIKCIPAPVIIASLSFLTSVIISSKSRA
ncbi:PREDICTED: ecto-ADP-ribosyltransferase 4 [Ceratotherium simum simum]|uniref:NAD(P)(+)--arginine ADP-ribosyltransferase n=1 Tax=Ceratotherium simum simum TaxID=73337 RepID=A0ABM0HWP8_CERSS|nr:PREDICTED: ecto-ADP-ribosyltransferase 4 [Ceratotherium simum simum]